VSEIFDSAVEENCIYTCPGGESFATDVMPTLSINSRLSEHHPMRNKLHTPSSDGCGSLGMQISTEYLPAPEMAKCCDAHDICYDTCNNDKELCDLDFKRCLYKYCDTFEKGPAGDIIIKGCKGTAKMLFTGTMTLGCKSYLDSQQRACYCPPVGPQSHSKKSGERERDKGRKPKDKKSWKSGDDL